MNQVRRQAVVRLATAGVPSPERDADELLAHVLGIGLGRLPLVEEVTSAQRERYDALVARRCAREPLQHLTGTAAFRHVEVAVGPGVFVPRPETELLAGWAIEQARLAPARRPVRDGAAAAETARVVDLCTGSGAIAKAVSHEVPEARVGAVELSESAFSWASRNLAGTDVDLRQGDMVEAFPELTGLVDVVVCNPPYVPLEAWESVAPEARDHDPHLALFAGPDGLDALRALEGTASRLLRPGGVVGAEHADVQGEAAVALFTASGRWTEVADHRDLAGRPRFVTARLAR